MWKATLVYAVHSSSSLTLTVKAFVEAYVYRVFDDAKAREHYLISRIYVEVAGAHATRLFEKKRLSKKPMKWRLGKRKQQRQKKKY